MKLGVLNYREEGMRSDKIWAVRLQRGEEGGEW